jgi:hypothetical protein
MVAVAKNRVTAADYATFGAVSSVVAANLWGEIMKDIDEYVATYLTQRGRPRSCGRCGR